MLANELQVEVIVHVPEMGKHALPFPFPPSSLLFEPGPGRGDILDCASETITPAMPELGPWVNSLPRAATLSLDYLYQDSV